jgi:acetyl-CoA carboxylase biotin carboxyl carrier protein
VSARRRAPARPPASPARALLDPRELRKLTLLMEESGLVELELESGGEKVRLVRASALPSASAAVGGAAALSGVQATTRAERREAEIAGGARAITSPMVGTFHRAAAPDQPAFAEVGDVVERGQALCVIEAMKMMNEIEAEFRGRIVKIVVENGRPVEYGEALFLIEPV